MGPVDPALWRWRERDVDVDQGAARIHAPINYRLFKDLSLEASAISPGYLMTPRCHCKGCPPKSRKSHLPSPEHPGIPHYIIHSYDYPELAMRGVLAAARCAQLAPSAPHALHMPSHIFSTVGMWQDVIQSDRAADGMTMSYTTRINQQAATNQAANPARYHSLDFLTNAHLQLVQDREAKQIVDVRNSFAEYPASFRYSGHTAFAAIPVRYALERGAWAEAAALQVSKTPFAQAEAITWFGRGIGAARSGDVAAAKEAAEQLRTLKDKLAKADDSYWAGQVEIQERAVAAWSAFGEGRRGVAIGLMRQAADLEDNSGRHVTSHR